MNKFKMLALTTIGMGILSGLSFAQDFPVNVTANVTAPASQYTLKVNGREVDTLNIDIGEIKILDLENTLHSIEFEVFLGDKNVTKDLNYVVAKPHLENAIGKVDLKTVYSTVDNNEWLMPAFTGKAPGLFKESTTLKITSK